MSRSLPPPLPLARILASNVFILSAGYLVVGLFVELLQRLSASRVFGQLGLAVDAIPMRILSLFGVLGPLRDAVLEERYPPFVLRLILSGTMIALIALLAVSLGVLMALARAFANRRRADRV